MFGSSYHTQIFITQLIHMNNCHSSQAYFIVLLLKIQLTSQFILCAYLHAHARGQSRECGCMCKQYTHVSEDSVPSQLSGVFHLLFCDRTSHQPEDLSCRSSPLAVKLQESFLFCFLLYSTGITGGLQDYCCPWLFMWVLCLYPLDLMLCVRLLTDGPASCSLTTLPVLISLLPTFLPLKNLLGLSFMQVCCYRSRICL